jgi:hypothetical protein
MVSTSYNSQRLDILKVFGSENIIVQNVSHLADVVQNKSRFWFNSSAGKERYAKIAY